MGRHRVTGKTVCIDCKSSATARLTPRQTKGYPEIEGSGATIAGEGKSAFPGGSAVEPLKVRIIRP
jgi:filamentous hemagglutinin